MTPKGPPFAVRRVPVGDVKENPDNPRSISVDQFKRLVASVREFPQMLDIRPLVVDADMVVLGGNMRLKACREAGLASVPVVIADTLTPEQRREFVIKDNASFGAWDWDALANEWSDLPLADWGVDVPAFEPPPVEGLTDPDEVPDAPKEPRTKLGDIYALGEHRLICGDSTDAGAWDRLMAGDVGDMVWTDPPYGVAYVGKTKDALTIENDALDEAGLAQLLGASLGLAWANSRAGASWYVAAPARPLHQVFGQVLLDLEVWRQTLVWVKDVFVLGRSDYHYRHEPIFYGWKQGAAHYFVDDRTQDTIWEIPRPKRSAEHPTMKPVALVERAIRNSSKAGEIVLEPFGGSGTTLLAAEATKRRCRCIELDPRYCDVIVDRWEAFSGKRAELLSVGEQ
jgi:site-specific DNA-methyltransferase (adenine-specific)